MNAADRAQLKRLVDAKRREQIRIARGDNTHSYCVGCGGEMEGVTEGCFQCRDRRTRRRIREAEQNGMRHGTEVAYTHFTCRCILCRQAGTDARRARRQRRAAA